MNYLVIKGSHGSGLGDLIRAVVVGVAYAGLTDRCVYVDWRGGIYNHPAECNLFDDLFTLCGIRTTRTPPCGDSVYPPRWINSLDKSFSQLYNENRSGAWNRRHALETYSFDPGVLDYSEEILVMWAFDGFSKLRAPLSERSGVPAALQRDQVEGMLLRRHLRLAPPVEELLERSWSKIPHDLPLVGVHVRLTEESVRERGDIALQRYWQALESLQKSHGAIRIFLATDNHAVQEIFRQRYGEMLVYNVKWLDKAGAPLHLNNRECPDSWANITGALLDMFMLARCDALVCPAHSSFSIVSRMAGDIPAEKTITLMFHGSFLGRVRKKVKQLLRRYRAATRRE